MNNVSEPNWRVRVEDGIAVGWLGHPIFLDKRELFVFFYSQAGIELVRLNSRSNQTRWSGVMQSGPCLLMGAGDGVEFT